METLIKFFLGLAGEGTRQAVLKHLQDEADKGRAILEETERAAGPRPGGGAR